MNVQSRDIIECLRAPEAPPLPKFERSDDEKEQCALLVNYIARHKELLTPCLLYAANEEKSGVVKLMQTHGVRISRDKAHAQMERVKELKIIPATMPLAPSAPKKSLSPTEKSLKLLHKISRTTHYHGKLRRFRFK